MAARYVYHIGQTEWKLSDGCRSARSAARTKTIRTSFFATAATKVWSHIVHRRLQTDANPQATICNA